MSAHAAALPAPLPLLPGSPLRPAAVARRIGLALALAATLLMPSGGRAASEQDWSQVRDGTVVLFRHANAPGGRDPPGFDLQDCRTQRNLDEEGRAQARRIGAAFRSRSIAVGAVLTSRWCRARDTAQLAFPGQPRAAAAFDSFFDQPDQRTTRTAQALALLLPWQGPGVLVVFTHQVNIVALTGTSTASGQGVVVLPDRNGLRVLGRVHP